MGGDAAIFERCSALCVDVMGKIGSEDILLVPTETCSAKFRTKSTVSVSKQGSVWALVDLGLL